MDIQTVCSKLINALQEAQYNESTMANYRRATNRFKVFCNEIGVSEYSPEVGRLYAKDVISPRTRKYSEQRRRLQARFVRLIDSYVLTGQFDFSIAKRGKIAPQNEYYHAVYDQYIRYLAELYENENTRHFYEYGMYAFLDYLEKRGDNLEICNITSAVAINYLKQTKPTRQREALCELRGICRFLNRADILTTLKGIHAPRHHRIIPILESDEQERIRLITEDPQTPLRDSAMILLGLSTGIRACDIIKLHIDDIDWRNDTISWKQSKTGNLVCIPLTPSVGNAIARYLIEERPDAPNDYLFVRLIAPFEPLSSHSSCYRIVKRILDKACVSTNDRIIGMHMLRHNAASTMVKNEVPIETIAAILGHAHPDTTGIYITTDQERLKECVLPFGSISKEVIL